MTLTILSLEDEADVRQALERNLEDFEGPHPFGARGRC